MIKTLSALAGAACLAAAASAAAPAHAAPACDEACLDGVADQYLAALVARDPSRLPLAANARYTENTRPMKFGDGLWATASGLGPYRHHFDDVAQGQAGLYSVIEENGSPALFTLRLKVVAGKITEAEALVVRQQTMGAFLRTDATTVKPIWNEPTPPDERMSREAMIKAVDHYFDGLNQGNGDIVPFDDDCTRTENGTQTVNNPPGTEKASMFPDHPELKLGEMTCRAQFNTGLVKYIHEVNPRRYVIVDPAKGLVFGFFMFHHPGNITEVDVPGVGKVPMIKAALAPFDVEVAELFKLKHGKIREIEAEMVSLPYRSDTGWDR
ncbi:MAG: hypothetical protein WDM92_03360 [Caulobacteraceae bacterium]